MNEADEETLARALRERLRASETLDPGARARLSAARARALEAARSRSWAWMGAGGLVAASLLAALLVLRPSATPPTSADVAQADEAFEWMLDQDDPALDPQFYEDLDLLHWMAEGDDRA